MDPGLGGFGCSADTDCYNGWVDASGDVLPALSPIDQSKRCCQFTALNNIGGGSFDAQFFVTK